jgi:hypothetical protein
VRNNFLLFQGIVEIIFSCKNRKEQAFFHSEKYKETKAEGEIAMRTLVLFYSPNAPALVKKGHSIHSSEKRIGWYFVLPSIILLQP